MYVFACPCVHVCVFVVVYIDVYTRRRSHIKKWRTEINNKQLHSNNNNNSDSSSSFSSRSNVRAEQPGLFAFWSEKKNRMYNLHTFLHSNFKMLWIAYLLCLYHSFTFWVQYNTFGVIEISFILFYGLNSSKHNSVCHAFQFLFSTHTFHSFTDICIYLSVNCRGFISVGTYFAVSFNLNNFNFIIVQLFRSLCQYSSKIL